MNDLKYWVALHQVSGLGPAAFAKLEGRLGDLETAWHAPLSDLAAAGVPRKVAAETERFRSENEPDEVMGKLEQLGITAIHLRHPEYPAQLAETPAARSVIYVKGQLFAADEKAIAIVGSRNATPYGLEMTRRISYDLARAGVTVVSGLARGIDTAAHRAALEAGAPSPSSVQVSTAYTRSAIFQWLKRSSKTGRFSPSTRRVLAHCRSTSRAEIG